MVPVPAQVSTRQARFAKPDSSVAVYAGCDEIDFSAPKLADRNGAVPSQQFQVDHVFDAVSEVALPFAKQPESKSHIAQIIFGFAMQIRFALQVVSGCFEK